MPITRVGKSKDGKQRYRVRVNYTDRNGKAHQIERIAYGNVEAKQLEAALARECRQVADGMTRMTVNDLFAKYMETKRNEVRQSTLDKSRRELEANVLPHLGQERLDRLNAQKLQEWKSVIAARNVAIITKQNAYKELRSMLNYAVRMEYLPRNPLNNVGNFKDTNFSTPKDKLHYYTPEQFRRFIAVAREQAEEHNTFADWGYYVFFMIAFFGGLRKGEINALKWSDIDGNILHVRRSVCQKVKGAPVVETSPKNRTSYRSLEMPTPLITALEEHRQRYLTDGSYRDDLRICGGAECLSDSSIAGRNIRFANAAGLPHIRIHDFRHSHASLLANEGINIQEIARRLGHARIEETWNTYAHLYPREEERAIAVLNRVL